MADQRRKPPPIDAQAAERLALRYVERFATSRARLASYLRRKIRERGWDGPPVDPDAIAERLAALGYVDDEAFAEARARGMRRRGLGDRRIDMALRAAGIDEEVRATATECDDETTLAAALKFARRRHIGPFAAAVADPALARRQLAQMLRAGHDYQLSRRIVAMKPGEDLALDDAD